jgi:type II restriction enzyme
LQGIRTYGTTEWNAAVHSFVKIKGRLIDLYDKRKKAVSKEIQLPYGTKLSFSPGKHNELQIKVLQEFRSRFCPESKVVYVGDAASKMLHLDAKLLSTMGIPITQHDKLPDVVLYDEKKNLLFLIEAVTSHGPLSPKRQVELEKTLKDCKAKRAYISAFPDFSEFKRHIDNIAWETEVWVESNPDHMIHFNGPKFITVYET